MKKIGDHWYRATKNFVLLLFSIVETYLDQQPKSFSRMHKNTSNGKKILKERKKKWKERGIVGILTVSFIWIWLILILNNLCLKSSLNTNLSPSTTSLPWNENIFKNEQLEVILKHSHYAYFWDLHLFKYLKLRF